MEITTISKREDWGVQIPHWSTAIVSSCQAVVGGLPAWAVVGVPESVLWGQVIGEYPLPGAEQCLQLVSFRSLKELAFSTLLDPQITRL